ncbi:coiled-coil domain-containing protein 74B [Scleropages formosus]|uniref:Si:ch211-222n4.2 n=1 Tax=Scleropages formosus TaxID=113540 RepID=A0A8C9WAL1_SCLFO|nr:coiled-coil domain-containing protein 74B [Scleropages formosus]
MFSSSLPPVGHLPHWPRVGGLPTAERPRLLRPAPGSEPRATSPPHGDREHEHEQQREQEQERAELRLSLLHRDIRFLQEQHKETLEKLHEELEHLRRDNKELQYRLIMEIPQPQGTTTPGSIESEEAPRQETEGPQKAEDNLDQPIPQEPNLRMDNEGDPTVKSKQEPELTLRRGLITSLHPVRIHNSPSQPPRAPTLQECEVIIQQLYHTNSLQSQEILRMRAILQNIISSKKVTPEAFVMTKAFITDHPRAKEQERFPELPRRPLPRRLPELQSSVGGRLSLPPLKQSLGSSVAERQKKVQALQRGRLRRTVH